MKPKTVQVHDKMQHGYTYELVASPGRGFAEGFEPELSPAEMLRLGVFGGKYMTGSTGSTAPAGSPNCELHPAVDKGFGP